MMVSPESKRNDYLEMCYEELVNEKDYLVLQIKQFELDEIMGNLDDELQEKPSPDTRYHMELLYLAELLPILAERFDECNNDWVPEDPLYMCPGNPGVND